jgi:hypothetical protein
MFSRPASPDWEAFVACLRRAGTPRRVHHIELFLDQELQDAIVERFDLARGIRSDDPFLLQKVKVALQRFLGYDYVTSDLDGFKWIVTEHEVADTAERARTGGKSSRVIPGPTPTSRRRVPWSGTRRIFPTTCA